MNTFSKYMRDRLIAFFASFLSLSFLINETFQSNQQNCVMINVIKRKKKEGDQEPEVLH